MKKWRRNIVCLFWDGEYGYLSEVLVLTLVDNLKHNQSYLKITKPYQRFKASMWALHFSIIQHFHLRGILRRKGFIPKKLVAFLEEAKDHHILKSDGGSWRFRHRILQDYFAKYWGDNYNKE